MRTIALLTALFAVALAGPPAAGAAAATQYEGTVKSVNSGNRTFRLHDSERGTIRIKVTSRTRFERIAGFGGLRAGQTGIEALVRRSNGRWVAVQVERSGRNRGGDDHGGHGSDD